MEPEVLWWCSQQPVTGPNTSSPVLHVTLLLTYCVLLGFFCCVTPSYFLDNSLYVFPIFYMSEAFQPPSFHHPKVLGYLHKYPVPKCLSTRNASQFCLDFCNRIDNTYLKKAMTLNYVSQKMLIFCHFSFHVQRSLSVSIQITDSGRVGAKFAWSKPEAYCINILFSDCIFVTTGIRERKAGVLWTSWI